MKRTLSNSYKFYYEKASIFPQQSDKKEINFFVSIVKKDKQYSILDIGCAEGELAIALAKEGHQVTAADISKNQLNKIIEKVNNSSISINTICCDIEDNIADFTNKTYDYIFFMDVLEHLKSPIKGLENIRLLLRDNGNLIIHTPNSCSLYKFIRYLLLPRKKQNFYNLNKIGNLHLSSYDYLTIEQTLNFIGLKVRKIIPTKLSVPFFNRFKLLNFLFNFMSFLFPLLSDTILLVCEKSKPIDIDELLDNWEKRN